MNNELKDRIKMPINVYLWNKLEKDDEIMYFSLIRNENDDPSEILFSSEYPKLKINLLIFILNYGIMMLL